MIRSSSRRRLPARLVATLGVVAILAAACSDDSGEDADPTVTAADEAAAATTTTEPATTAPIPESAESLESLQLNIVEFGDAGYVEIINTGAEAATLAGVNICQFPTYKDLGDIVDQATLESGATLQIPAAELGGLDAAGGEAALYDGNDFGSPEGMLSYVQWGVGGHRRASVAAEAGLWPSADDFVTPDPTFNSIESGGFAADPEGWS